MNETYSSSTGGENALKITSGETVLENPTITKTGDESSENSDFYGTNAAVLVSGGSLEISGGSVETNASHANAVFAYGDGSISLEKTSIKTTGNNSGGVMVTGGGTLTATDLSVETSGNSSAAIRSDRGGGTLTVSGGSYKTSGMGSPVIYSTANISVSDGAELTSTASEGVVIEGLNSVSLNSVSLTATNNTLNGNSETYKTIFIYQSMSGDAKEGTGEFSATSSIIESNKGDLFYITNTTADISLSGNKLINNDKTGVFLRAEGAKWGRTGQNGGLVALTFESQVASGDIVLDSLSSLDFYLSEDSFYQGTINGENSASSVALELDEASTFVLTGDSYLSSLENSAESNENIYANGFSLYVAGAKVSINESEAPALPEVSVDLTSEPIATGVASDTVITDAVPAAASAPSSSLALIISLSVCCALLIGLIIFAILKLRKKSPNPPEVILPPSSPETPTPAAPEAPEVPAQTPQEPSKSSSPFSVPTEANPQLHKDNPFLKQ